MVPTILLGAVVYAMLGLRKKKRQSFFDVGTHHKPSSKPAAYYFPFLRRIRALRTARGRTLMRSSVALVLIFSVALGFRITSLFANTTHYYPTQCAGDWEASNAAAGMPETGRLLPPYFNQHEHAARLTAPDQKLFCYFETPTHAIPVAQANVTAYLSLQTEETLPVVLEEAPVSPTPAENPAESVEPEPLPSEVPQEEQEAGEATDVTEVPQDEDLAPAPAEPVSDLTMPAEEETAPEPAESIEETPVSSAVHWLLARIISSAHAQEQSQEELEVDNPAPTETPSEEVIEVEPETPVLDVTDELPSELPSEDVPTESAPAPENVSPDTSDVEPPSEPGAEQVDEMHASSTQEGEVLGMVSGAEVTVSYTLDGVLWTELPVVTSMSKVTFDFPIESTSDLGRLVVRVTGDPVDTKGILLDAVEVEVLPTGDLPDDVVLDFVATRTSPPDFTSDILLGARAMDDVVVFSVHTQATASSSEAHRILLVRSISSARDTLVLAHTQLENMQPDTPIALKGGRVFWRENASSILSFDIETGLYFRTMLESKRGGELEAKFDKFPWTSIVRGNQFFFSSSLTGEVVSDDDSNFLEEARSLVSPDLVRREDLEQVWPSE